MNLNIKIDFSNTYEIENISADLKRFQFNTLTKTREEITLHVIIEKNYNQFVPDIFNLGFGPLTDTGTLNDKIPIQHQDNSKVYSTILLGALTFLNSNPDAFVGVDGSDITRAYLYYKLLQNNYDYLVQFIDIIGVKYYIRLLRGIKNSDPLVPDGEDLATQPFKISKGEHIGCTKLFNYFIFKLASK